MEKKKKLLIVNNNLDTGGVQRSLINLISSIGDNYQVTLFLFSNTGEYKELLPKNIEIVEAAPLLNLLGISQIKAKEKGTVLYLIRGCLAVFTKIFGNMLPIWALVHSQRKMKGYDFAISYLHPCTERILYGGCTEFVLDRVSSTVKIAWLHCDFMEYGGNSGRTRRMLSHFDRIVTVSKSCRESFVKVLPQMENKTYWVPNLHDYQEYTKRSNEQPIYFEQEGLNLVSACRLSQEKGIWRGIQCFSRLKKQGYHFCWHIIGDGPEKEKILAKIKEEKMEKEVILYGNQKNPYRYIKAADLFFLPSYHEAAPMVIGEAKALGIPVLTTETISAKEMIQEGKEGFVSFNSEEGIYESLKRLLEHPEQISICTSYLSRVPLNNELSINQLNLIFEDD